MVLIFSGVIVINGVTTEVYLGDESHHFRFAQSIYQEGRRVPFDPLYESGDPPGFFNNDPPLWHLGLAFLWKIAGGTYQAIAQVYHVLFLMLLIWMTSLVAKEMIGKEGEVLSGFIIATVPMIVSFSTLLYMDVPLTALVIISFYLILKKNFLGAGIASGLMYFTKLNAAFFFPGFLFLILLKNRKRVLYFLKNLTLFVFPILLIHLTDLYWRRHNIPTKLNIISLDTVSHRLSFAFMGRWKEYLNSYLTNPIDIIKYFGIAFLLLLFMRFIKLRRWEQRDNTLLIPVISYLIIFLVVFGINTDIRYLMPILPFLVVFSIPSFLTLGRKWQIIFVVLCLIQFISTNYYVHEKRKIPQGVKEAYSFIKTNLPKEALILYPEENLLIYGQRRMVWSAFSIGGNLYSLFWETGLEELNNLLKANKVDHILIKKSRIFDDSKEKHIGGYPKSFVEKISKLEGWMKIFENNEMVLWKKVQS